MLAPQEFKSPPQRFFLIKTFKPTDKFRITRKKRVEKTLRHGCTSNDNKRLHLAFLFFIITIFLSVLVGTSVSADALLEISVSIVEEDPFGPDDTFHYIVEIRNREAEGRIDVTVTYDVLDSDDIVLLSDSKTVAIETKSSFAEEFTLPSSISEGTYLFRANVTTLDGSKWSEASRSFSVIVVEEGEQRVIEYVMVVALAFTGGGLLFEHRRVSKLKVSGRDLKKFVGEHHKK